MFLIACLFVLFIATVDFAGEIFVREGISWKGIFLRGSMLSIYILALEKLFR